MGTALCEQEAGLPLMQAIKTGPDSSGISNPSRAFCPDSSV